MKRRYFITIRNTEAVMIGSGFEEWVTAKIKKGVVLKRVGILNHYVVQPKKNSWKYSVCVADLKPFKQKEDKFSCNLFPQVGGGKPTSKGDKR